MWQSLFDSENAFNSAELISGSHFKPWVVALVIAIALLVLWLGWRTTRRVSRTRRIQLLVLRLLAVSALLVVFLEPTLELSDVTRLDTRVAVILGDSQSMSLPGQKSTRIQDGVDALATALNDLRTRHNLEFYALSDELRAIADPTVPTATALTAKGERTDFMLGLSALAARKGEADLAGVVLISDGADNASLAEGAPPVPGHLESLAHSLSAPVHALFTGPDEPPPDSAIVSVDHDAFAFVQNATLIHVTVRAEGLAHQALPLTLRQGEKVLQQRIFEVLPNQRDVRFDFEFVPSDLGDAVFTLELEPAPGEVVTQNNRRDFALHVLRDKLRVLQVVGQPSWDERFLRTLLSEHPNIDLISFFILRTTTSIESAHQDELSLIPFPTQELFEVELGSFDLVIFQNFSHVDYQMSQYLPRIADYVRNGGGLLMLGGELSFTKGGYQGTAIEEILPIYLPPKGSELTSHERFRAVPTEAGLHHPLTALESTPEKTRALWAKLPELDGQNRTAGLKPGAVALLENPKLSPLNIEQNRRVKEPLLAIWNVQKGRVAAIMTDSLWNYAFENVATGGDSRAYHRLFSNMLRWLSHDPALQTMTLQTSSEHYSPNEEVTATARLLGGFVDSLADRTVHFKVTAEGNDEPILFDEKTDESGLTWIRFKPENEGPHCIEAWLDQENSHDLNGITMEDETSTHAQVHFLVAPNGQELSDLHARRAPLETIANSTGGQVRTLSQGLRNLPFREGAVLKVNRQKRVPLWSNVICLLLGLLLPCAEWALRRRSGLS